MELAGSSSTARVIGVNGAPGKPTLALTYSEVPNLMWISFPFREKKEKRRKKERKITLCLLEEPKEPLAHL